MAGNERRAYQRENFNCDAKLSRDGVGGWSEIQVSDLSSGGLQMKSEDDIDVGAAVWFDITMYGLASGFEVKAKGQIRRKLRAGGYFVYGALFSDLPRDVRVRIDEAISQSRRYAPRLDG
ncbi:MAG: PilZ domain-containing protein [Clostridiales bacterium]|jgi:hypothetical protein|nr:PilZ domain-containing protein [Clostridiales bacterium]